MLKRKFYDVQQRLTDGGWVSIGFFLSKKEAEKYEKSFNTKTKVSSTKIEKREFLDGAI